MRMIKLFPALHVEMRIHVSDEMVKDFEKCKEAEREGKELPCDTCIWDAVDVFCQNLCGLPEVEAKVLAAELQARETFWKMSEIIGIMARRQTGG